MTLPTYDFNEQSIKLRYGERYASEALNKKFLGLPRGVYLGFVPSVSGRLLTLSPDSGRGFSLCRLLSPTAGHPICIDVVINGSVVLDFTDHDFVADPTAYVICAAFAELGQASTATVFTRSTTAVDPQEQLICVVTESSGALVVASDQPTNQSSPYAWSTAPLGYGFMRSNAIEELQQAVLMVGEVADARVDLTALDHPWNPPFDYGLTDRVEADLLPAAIASRLAIQHRVIFGEDHAASTGDTVNVSGSFSETSRTRLPIQTFEPNGSETQEGVITDADRNICFFTIVGTNERPVDPSRICGYGRLEFDEITLSGTSLTFPAGTVVTGIGTAFLSEIEAGDLVEGPDGLFYEVASVTDDFTFTLVIPAALPGVVAPTQRRRWTLRLIKNVGQPTGEQPFNITGSVTIRLFFGAFLSLGASVFDATLMFAEGGEVQPLPDAAVGVEGGVLMHPGLIGALAGAVQSVLAAGATIGAGVPTYSLNFTAASNGGSGVANIDMTGPIGPVGAPGTGIGPTGLPGDPGLAFDIFNAATANANAYDPAFYAALQPITPGGHIETHSKTYPSTLRYLHGGIAQWSGTTFFVNSNDGFDIDDVFRSGPTQATGNIVHRWPGFGGSPLTKIGIFLNGAG